MTRLHNRNDPNIGLLEVVAHRLGDALLQELVFVGGAVAGLLVTDPAMPLIRPTEDVDLIVEVAARPDFHRVEAMLRAQGFAPDLRVNAPICRWCIDTVTVDIMPTLEEILGFANAWYQLAVSSASKATLPSGIDILLVQAPVFIATKLEAFAGRGGGDYLFSHDLGDLISVIDGRDSLLAECQASPSSLRHYLADKFGQFMQDRAFLDALPGHLPSDAASQERLPDLHGKLKQLAHLPH